MRRMRAFSSGAVAVTVGLLLSGGCAHSTPSLSPADEAATGQLLVKTYERVFGTVADSNAVSYLVNHAAEVNIATCMTDGGYQYHSPWVKDSVGPITASDNWLAPLSPTAVSTVLSNAAEATRRGLALDSAQPQPGTPEATADYQAALEKCVRNAHEPSPEKFQPDLAYKLLAPYRSIVDQVEARPDWTSGYKQCMADRGWTSSGAYDTYKLVESHRPAWNEIPTPGEQETSAWTKFLAFEDSVFSDDIACRADYYHQAIAQIEPLLQAFLTTHKDELTTLDAAWADVRQQATAAGWPQGA